MVQPMKAKVKEHLSSNELRELGYRLSVVESGYISADSATIIHLFRKPQNGQVEMYWKSNDAEAHLRNMQALREGGYLDE